MADELKHTGHAEATGRFEDEIYAASSRATENGLTVQEQVEELRRIAKAIEDDE